jgi:3-oxoacyl-[acyl-carrier protein] reductase
VIGAATALSGHTAIVTGANHGIGAAIATALARSGASVLVSYLRLHDAPDDAHPDTYRRARKSDARSAIGALCKGWGCRGRT